MTNFYSIICNFDEVMPLHYGTGPDA